MKRREFIGLSVGTLGSTALSYEIAAEGLARAGAEGLAKLRGLAAARGLRFGSAVSFAQLNRPGLAALLVDQCSILVSENDMKWRATQPELERFDFTRADAFMQLAEAHGIPARGHNLCWHEHNPEWLETTATSANAVNMLRTHIQTVAGRYKGRIHSWDVVNEAIRPDHHNPNDMVNSVWLKTIGEDYVEIAFRAAAAADPTALLTYNDYDIETDSPEQQKKREAILAMLRRFRKNHVPIHAVGVQAHLRPKGEPLTWKGLNEFLKELKKMKLQVFVTELDVDDSTFPSEIPERDRMVGEVYRNFLNNILRQNAVSAILTWCLCDRDTWLTGFRPRKDGQPQRPLPFDPDLQPTPAFFALRDAFSNHK